VRFQFTVCVHDTAIVPMQKSGKFLALADGGRRTPGRTIAFGFDQLKSQGTTECRVAEPGGPLTLDRPAAPLESDWIGF
jgi:hypothetical protein